VTIWNQCWTVGHDDQLKNCWLVV